MLGFIAKRKLKKAMVQVHNDLVRTYVWFKHLEKKVPFDDGLIKGASNQCERELRALNLDPDKLVERSLSKTKSSS